jgi:hypothetical protein
MKTPASSAPIIATVMPIAAALVYLMLPAPTRAEVPLCYYRGASYANGAMFSNSCGGGLMQQCQGGVWGPCQ